MKRGRCRDCRRARGRGRRGGGLVWNGLAGLRPQDAGRDSPSRGQSRNIGLRRHAERAQRRSEVDRRRKGRKRKRRLFEPARRGDRGLTCCGRKSSRERERRGRSRGRAPEGAPRNRGRKAVGRDVRRAEGRLDWTRPLSPVSPAAPARTRAPAAMPEPPGSGRCAAGQPVKERIGEMFDRGGVGYKGARGDRLGLCRRDRRAGQVSRRHACIRGSVRVRRRRARRARRRSTPRAKNRAISGRKRSPSG